MCSERSQAIGSKCESVSYNECPVFFYVFSWFTSRCDMPSGEAFPLINTDAIMDAHVGIIFPTPFSPGEPGVPYKVSESA